MEKRNKQRIEALVKDLEQKKADHAEKEGRLWSLISPYIANVAHGSEEDVAKLVEVRQHLICIRGDYIFRQITDALKGKDTNVAVTEGWLPEDVRLAIKDASNMYEFYTTRWTDAEDALIKYIARYLNNRDGYRTMEILNEIITMLPDCYARYNLMKSREYLRKMEAKK